MNAEPRARQCRDCLWWTGPRDGSSYEPFECHGGPKQAVMMGTGDYSSWEWPQTTMFDWCGLHKPTEENKS